jgi:hypothetical protein
LAFPETGLTFGIGAFTGWGLTVAVSSLCGIALTI